MFTLVGMLGFPHVHVGGKYRCQRESIPPYLLVLSDSIENVTQIRWEGEGL